MPTPPALVNLQAYEGAARERLPRMVYDYYAGGAGDEVTLGAARAAWDAIELRYRVLRDVSVRSLRTEILGHALEWPALVAPMAFQQMATPEAELATARAAAATGAGMILSTLSNQPIEAVRASTGGPLWFQLYIYRERAATEALVRRAEQAGCTALVLTVDSPMLGRRERDLLNGFHVPTELPVPNLGASPRGTLASARTATSALATFVAEHWDASISWKDLKWLRSITTVPVLVKGVVRADDAERALDEGASGVIVSNHGGRQLDTSLPTARALRAIADALKGRGTLLVDGGIRRGTDIVKALALGAQGVLVGRPVLWGLAIDGAAGAQAVLQLLKDEFDLALGLAGCRDLLEVTRDLVEP